MSRAHYRTTPYSAPCRPRRPVHQGIRILMHRELFPSEHERNGLAGPTGIRPYGRSWQRPGVTPDHGPVPRRRTRMSWRGSWLAKYGAVARSPVHRRETSRLYRLQRTRGDHGNLSRRSRRTAPATSRRAGRKVIYDYPRHFPEFLPLASSRKRPYRSRAVRPGRRDTAGAGGRERRLGARRDMIDTVRIRGRPLRSDRMCHTGATRSSTARYLILYRIKVT
jgi:hypothetical protein